MTVDLLCQPTEAELSAEGSAPSSQVEVSRLARVQCSQQFSVAGAKQALQYADLYFWRLNKLRVPVKAEAEQVFKGVPHCRVLDAAEGQESVLVGTIYKTMKMKPNILDEYKSKPVEQVGKSTSIVSDDDVAVVEDESGRVNLAGTDVGMLPTGVVAAIKGIAQENGDFKVSAISFAGVPPVAPKPASLPSGILFVSSLNLGGDSASPLTGVLLDFIAGWTGNMGNERHFNTVVLLGDSCDFASEEQKADGRNLNNKAQAQLVSPVKVLDEWICRAACACDVILLPGDNDPSTTLLPQPPLMSCLLPRAGLMSTVHSATNPALLTADGLQIFATAGQNVRDVLRTTKISSAAQVVKDMLHWRHTAPTGPDTLPCVPFVEADPFLLETCPHVFAVGGCACAELDSVQAVGGSTVDIVCAPDFSKTSTAVLYVPGGKSIPVAFSQ